MFAGLEHFQDRAGLGIALTEKEEVKGILLR